MKKLIVAIVLAVTLSLGIIGHSMANVPGETKPLMFVCKADGAAHILSVATNKTSTKVDMGNAMQNTIRDGSCARFPVPVEVKLVELLEEFVDFEKVKVQLWKVTPNGSDMFYAFYVAKSEDVKS